MVNSADFAKRLEKIMEFYDLTATALADEIDFNRSTISHLISGRNKPSLEFVMKILQKYPEVKLDWLVLGKGSFPPTNVEKQKTLDIPQTSQSAKPADLFSQELNIHQSTFQKESTGKTTIDRIVVFFTDGTYKNYEN